MVLNDPVKALRDLLALAVVVLCIVKCHSGQHRKEVSDAVVWTLIQNVMQAFDEQIRVNPVKALRVA